MKLDVLNVVSLALLIFSQPSFRHGLAYAQDCVQPQGVIAWWPFDETNGARAFDLAGDHTGGHIGGPSPASGLVGAALQFDGRDDFVAVPDSSSWEFGAQDFTIELWANFNTPGGSISHPSHILIGNDEGPFNVNKWFFALGGGFLSFHINSPTLGPKFFPFAPFSPKVGQWYHLAITRQAATFTIFINGLQVASAVNTDIIPNADAPLTIGQAEELGFMNGWLDEVTIYNRALSSAELRAIAAAGEAGKCKALSSLQVSQISPTGGGNAGLVTVVIRGSGFMKGTTVRLTEEGQTVVTGQATVVNTSSRIETTFDLRGQASRNLALEVLNPDGARALAQTPFMVENGGHPQMWVDISGRNMIRLGRENAFAISFGNTGNVDAWGSVLFVAVPKASATKLLPEPARTGVIDPEKVPEFIDSGDERLYSRLIDKVGAGETRQIFLTLSVSGGSGLAIKTWITPPFYLGGWPLPTKSAFSKLQGSTDDSPSEVDIYTDQFDAKYRKSIRDHLPEIHKEAIDEGFLTYPVTFVGAGIIALVFGAEITTAVGIAELATLGYGLVKAASSYKAVRQLTVVESDDPNTKVGPGGVLLGHWIQGGHGLSYMILFENLGNARAPAQKVTITDQLDMSRIEIESLELGPISFGNHWYMPLSKIDNLDATYDLRPEKNILVRLNAGLNKNTGLISWQLTSIDPSTGQPPEDPLAGFLPPNTNPPEGEGSVSFLVRPRSDLATGNEVRNKAVITFDTNQAISTTEWLNTIDNTLPTSRVLQLGVTQCASFPVRWSGEDSGSGIERFSVLVSEDGGGFNRWQNDTTATAGIFTGQYHKAYAFYSVARDRVGNLEVPPAQPDAFTRVGDDEAPIITPNNIPLTLWPPNHEYRTVKVSDLVAKVSDNCDSAIGIGEVLITQVSSDEPENGPSDSGANTRDDILIADDCKSVQLRAERDGSSNGRVYVVAVKLTDASGNVGNAKGLVTVPLSQGRGGAAVLGPGRVYTVTSKCGGATLSSSY